MTDFKRYRANAIQHGPLARSGHYPSRQNGNGAHTGQAEGSSDAVLDRNELPARFRRMALTRAEMEAIDVCLVSIVLTFRAEELRWYGR